MNLKAFLDTGNLTYDSYNNLPIVFINQKYKINAKKVSKINISTINNCKMVNLYEINDFYLEVNNCYLRKDCLIAFVDIKFDSIIGLNMLN